MIETKNIIDDKIQALEEQLKNVKGRETEQYARIVGYYRAVKNWNRGKKEEYKFRVNFSETTFKNELNGTVENSTPVIKEKVMSDSKITSYKLFYRTTCPNCPPVKAVMKQLDLEGESINADSSKGFTKAAIFEIFTAPTVVFLDSKGKEVVRATNISDLNKIIKENNL